MTLIEQLEQRTELMTSRDLATFLACHIKTLYGWTKASGLPTTRVGARLKHDPVAVARWLKQREIA